MRFCKPGRSSERRAGELDREDPRSLPVRRPLLACLAYSGVRVSELIGLRWRAVSLPRGVIVVERSKTTAGERAIDLQPELRTELIRWKAAAPSTDPDALVFPTRNGTRRDRHNIRQRIVLASVERANLRRAEQGREPLPEGLSPHSFRRTFATWLLSEQEDLAYVMGQLGHRSERMTMGVYAQARRQGRITPRSRRREALTTPEASPNRHPALEGVMAALDEEAA